MVSATRDREVEQGMGEEFVLAVQPFPPLLLSLLVAVTAPGVLRIGIFLICSREQQGREPVCWS